MDTGQVPHQNAHESGSPGLFGFSRKCESISTTSVSRPTNSSPPMKRYSAFRCTPLLASLLTVSVILPAALAEDWPRWGGQDPGRNMYSREKNLPYRFEPGKPKSGTEEIDLKTTQNVKWVAKLGSQSYGNVTVAGREGLHRHQQ